MDTPRDASLEPPPLDLDDRFAAYDDDAPTGRAASGKRIVGGRARTRFQRDFLHMQDRLHREGVR